MAFGKLLGGMFSRKKTIKSVTADDLHKERIGLENEERRLVKELDRLRKDDGQLISEYAAAGNSGDKHQKKILARRIQELRSQMGAVDQRHGFLTKQMRVVNGLTVIKENDAFFERLGANSKLNNMDLVELQQYVEQATIDGELTNEKLETLVSTMNEANAALADSEADTGLNDFMGSLDAELGEQGLIASADTSNEELDQAISALDKELAKSPSRTAKRADEKRREEG